MRNIFGCFGSALALVATPVLAQQATTPDIANTETASTETEPTSPITINGSATLTSDYRFRGISQTDKTFGIQGSITVSHESGLYASVYGYSVDDYVTASLRANTELDFIVGFKKTFGGTTFDIGALYYVYPKSRLPGDRSSSNFIEPYLAVSHTFGPVTGKATVAYAPKQKALALNQLGPKLDNVYIAGDLSAAIPGTPISLSAHIGHTFGPSWIAIGREYTDYGVGASFTYKALTLGVQYVDTDGVFITPTGRDAAKGGVLATLTASF